MTARLTLNEHEAIYPEHIVDLESLLERVNRRSLGSEIIVDVKIDGQIFSEEYTRQARDVRLADIDRVDVLSCSAETFSRDFLDQSSQYIDHLKSGFRLTIELLRLPDEAKSGYDMLARSLGALSALKAHLENIREVIEKLDIGGEVIELWQHFEGMAGLLHQAQKDMDPESIADLIDGQVLPFLDEWKKAA